MKVDELERSLAPTLGAERSREVVAHAMRRLQIVTDELAPHQVEAILGVLDEAQGVVALAARFARQRASMRTASVTRPPAQPSSPPDARSTPPLTGLTSDTPRDGSLTGRFQRMASGEHALVRISRDEIVAIFAPVIGQEKSEDVVDAAIKHLGFRGDAFDRRQGLALLEALADAPGVVGVTARFAKARFLLRRG